MAAKANQLRDMVIKEISLVMDPASPEADVIFTKAKAHDVSQEPRDKRGRWTTASEFTRSQATALAGHAKRMALRAFNAVKHPASVIASTLPKAARPIRGGGVQLDFHHTLTSGEHYISSVQIRHEHLASLKGPTAGAGQEMRLHRLRLALSHVESLLRWMGHREVEPFDAAPQQSGERGFGNLFRNRPVGLEEEERELRSRVVQLQQAQRVKDLRAQVERAERGGPLPPQLNLSSSAPNTASAAPVNNGRPVMPAAASIAYESQHSHGTAGIPTYMRPSMPVVGTPNGQPMGSGYGGKETVNGVEYRTPKAGGGFKEAGGNPYITPEGTFIPSGASDLQDHMERIAQWRRANGPIAEAHIAQNMMSNAQSVPRDTAGVGRAYFLRTPGLNGGASYVPPERKDRQERYEARYKDEVERRAAHEELAAANDLGLMGPAEDYRSAIERDDASEERGGQSYLDQGGGRYSHLFPSSEGAHVPVTRVPEDPALEASRRGEGLANWGKSAGAPGIVLSFGDSVSNLTPQEVRKRRLARVRSIAKSKVR